MFPSSLFEQLYFLILHSNIGSFSIQKNLNMNLLFAYACNTHCYTSMAIYWFLDAISKTLFCKQTVQAISKEPTLHLNSKGDNICVTKEKFPNSWDLTQRKRLPFFTIVLIVFGVALSPPIPPPPPPKNLTLLIKTRLDLLPRPFSTVFVFLLLDPQFFYPQYRVNQGIRQVYVGTVFLNRYLGTVVCRELLPGVHVCH